MKASVFNGFIDLFESDVYVGDYTEHAKEHEERHGIGVVFSDTVLPEIPWLHLINKNKVRIGAVNFEKCSYLFKNDKDQLVKQCEGLCFAARGQNHPWVLLIEMKYGKGNNIEGNIEDATYQLKKSLSYLRDRKGYIEKKDRIYWVAALPGFDYMAPFEHFAITQEYLLALKKELNVTAFFRQNTLEILTDSHIQVP